jgi:hypothetical protein
MKTDQQITQELAQEQAIFSRMVPGSIWRSPSPGFFYSNAPFFYLILSDELSSAGQNYIKERKTHVLQPWDISDGD